MSKKVIKRNNRNFIPTAENTYNAKKGVKAKWSFWVVLALMVFWSVGAVLGIFATARSCNDSASLKTVSAAESTPNNFYSGDIHYDGLGYYQDDFLNKVGSSTPAMRSPFVLNFLNQKYTPNDTRVAFVSKNFKYSVGDPIDDSVGFLAMRFTDGSYQPFSYFGSYERDGDIYYFYGMPKFSSSSINSLKYSYIFYYTYSKTFTNFELNARVAVGYNVFYTDSFFRLISEGGIQSLYDDAISIGEKLAFEEYSNFFSGAKINYTAKYIRTNEITIQRDGITPLYGENYLGFYSIYEDLLKNIPYGYEADNIKELSFEVVLGYPYTLNHELALYLFKGSNDFPASYEAFKQVGIPQTNFTKYYNFSYTDVSGTIANYSTTLPADKTSVKTFSFNFSFSSRLELRNILNTNFGLLNSDYYVGYEAGYQIGKNEKDDKVREEGYADGYYDGKIAGKNETFDKYYYDRYSEGYNAGAKSAGEYTFLGLFGAVVDAPITAISGLLNFDLLGFNMLNFFYALCTCALVIAVVRLFI